jgi:hypothetical protein
MRRGVLASLLVLLIGAGIASAQPTGTATATVSVGKASMRLSGGTCRRVGQGFQVRMIPGERRTFQLSFYTRKAGTHASRPSKRLGGRISFSRGRQAVYSTTFRIKLRAGAKRGRFSGKLAPRFARKPFRGAFSC